jgi:hypothetical protein
MNAIQAGYEKVKGYIDQTYEKTGKFLDKNPVLYKVVLVACHFFRALPMYGLMMWLPISKPVIAVAAAVMIGGTLLYRAAVERFCSFRFAIASMVGATAAWLAHAAIVNFVSGLALMSIGLAIANSIALVPLAAYVGWVIYMSHKDIEKRVASLSKSCCC